MPLRMTPNFEDLSCEFAFGQAAALVEDDPLMLEVRNFSRPVRECVGKKKRIIRGRRSKSRLGLLTPEHALFLQWRW